MSSCATTVPPTRPRQGPRQPARGSCARNGPDTAARAWLPWPRCTPRTSSSSPTATTRSTQARPPVSWTASWTGADLVIGSRTLGRRERGALTRSQTVGNGVAAILIRLLFGQRVTDLGPYRAIRAGALARLGMSDPAFGWTVEMQVKAIQHRLTTVEVPVDTRARIGESKISGTLRGAVGAGTGILGTIARLRWQRRAPQPVRERTSRT